LKQIGAPAGNKNAAKSKEWENALRLALASFEDKDAKVKRGQALRKIAETVIVKAMAGDKDAWQEIGNRLDGKPAQTIQGPTADGSIRIVHAVE
jgi:hypothetical protein